MTDLSTETYILYNKTIIRGRNVLVQNVRGETSWSETSGKRNVQVQNVPWRNVLGAKRLGPESPWVKRPGPKSQEAKRPGLKYQGAKRPSPKRQGVKRPGPKMSGGKTT